jgi:hypothetical protein
MMSCRGWRFNVWRQRLQVRPCTLFVYLQFGRFVQESCGNPGVRCCFSQPKQDRRLTHEVLFTDHMNFPVVSQRRQRYAGWGQRFLKVGKSEHIKPGNPEPALEPGNWNTGTFACLDLLEQSGAPSPGLRIDPRTAPAWPPCWGRFVDTRGGEIATLKMLANERGRQLRRSCFSAMASPRRCSARNGS